MEKENKNDNSAGCVKTVLYIFGALAVVMIAGGAMEGIGMDSRRVLAQK